MVCIYRGDTAALNLKKIRNVLIFRMIFNGVFFILVQMTIALKWYKNYYYYTFNCLGLRPLIASHSSQPDALWYGPDGDGGVAGKLAVAEHGDADASQTEVYCVILGDLAPFYFGLLFVLLEAGHFNPPRPFRLPPPSPQHTQV